MALLLPYLVVLGHILFVTEVVEIASIGLGVEFRDVWRLDIAEVLPLDTSEPCVPLYLLNRLVPQVGISNQPI